MSTTPVTPPEVGSQAPDVTLPSHRGSPVTLSGIYRTHHLVLYFVRRYT